MNGGMMTHFNVFALCLECKKRWIGTVEVKASLFELECPECHKQNSFASIIPDEYVDGINEPEEEVQLN